MVAAPAHLGKWADAYASPVRTYTLIHQGGPADGVTITLQASKLPQARFYAPSSARRRRVVTLARYVQHRAVELDVILYLYSGTNERQGPVPGMRESPAWSVT